MRTSLARSPVESQVAGLTGYSIHRRENSSLVLDIMVLFAATFDTSRVILVFFCLAGRDQLSEGGRYAALALSLPNMWSGSRR
jgi:hypothetical protein